MGPATRGAMAQLGLYDAGEEAAAVDARLAMHGVGGMIRTVRGAPERVGSAGAAQMKRAVGAMHGHLAQVAVADIAEVAADVADDHMVQVVAKLNAHVRTSLYHGAARRRADKLILALQAPLLCPKARDRRRCRLATAIGICTIEPNDYGVYCAIRTNTAWSRAAQLCQRRKRRRGR